ncbi:MAG: 2-succinyl-5-enolpyruvyl-6-hydroxy-3-cyclohexene-1-carboxylate synthase, partial [Chlorobi bacterium]|nr:2-succinyl-5-enolpyruvyl-6-hydroxy-3-cyclohexene-1-carboxylate synthase [Chlorobiota bacterium]
MIDKSNINIFRASLIVEELIRNGTDYFCVSPGSRSAPLTVAVARNAKAKHIVCFDERTAAFHALGYARATERPAALICTSGSAAANYLPAVIESDADMIPMIILSADRPPELLKRGANQTTNQPDMFKTFTREQSTLNISDRGLPHEYILREIDNLYSKSIGNYAGPVHINCMFR